MLRLHRGEKKPLTLLVLEEVEWYWWMRLGKIGKAYLLTSSLLSLLSSTLIIYILFQPLVVYDGFSLSGYVTPLSYSLKVAGSPVRYPFLDSLVTVSFSCLIFALVVGVLGVLGVIGTFKEWRSWVAFVPSSTASASLLVSLLYSLLRFASLDAIPTLPYTITINSSGGERIYLSQPSTVYTWVYYLPWSPLYFFIAFNILLALTMGSIILILLKPKTPVIRAKPPEGKEPGRSNRLLSRLRSFIEKRRSGVA